MSIFLNNAQINEQYICIKIVCVISPESNNDTTSLPAHWLNIYYLGPTSPRIRYVIQYLMEEIKLLAAVHGDQSLLISFE